MVLRSAHAEFDAMDEIESCVGPASFDRDAAFLLAAGEDGFQLRVALRSGIVMGMGRVGEAGPLGIPARDCCRFPDICEKS